MQKPQMAIKPIQEMERNQTGNTLGIPLPI
jgi:hypothetical protein